VRLISPAGVTACEIKRHTLKRTSDIENKSAIASALKATQLDTLVGSVAWGSGPTPNVAKTPLVGGQWGNGKNFPWEVTITSNVMAPTIPTAGTTRPMPEA
jgi:branched-chain amino acid transport system substrate-binding protein